MLPTPPAAFALAVTRVCRCDDDPRAGRTIGAAAATRYRRTSDDLGARSGVSRSPHGGRPRRAGRSRGGAVAGRRPVVAGARRCRVRTGRRRRSAARRLAVPDVRRRRAPHRRAPARRVVRRGVDRPTPTRAGVRRRAAAPAAGRSNAGGSSSSSCSAPTPTWSAGRRGRATRRGWRRRRFSELDPVQLAELLETVAPAELAGRAAPARRPGPVPHRRVPDHTADTPLGRPSAEARLLTSAGVDASPRRARGRWARSSSSSGSVHGGTGWRSERAVAPSASVTMLDVHRRAASATPAGSSTS